MRSMRTVISVTFLIAGAASLLLGIILLAASQGLGGGGLLDWLTNDPLATAAVALGTLTIIAEVYRLKTR
jgi:hypothetical protein